jgi:hypothetical protein
VISPTDPQSGCERIEGIREDLPVGERVLWQGAPSWGSMARHAFHVRKIALYFALIAGATAFSSWTEGQSVRSALVPAALGTVACLLLALGAFLSSRTTIYAITTRRVFLRVGIALPIDINLPLQRIATAGLATYSDGSGDLPLTLEAGAHLAYVHLWPHARPWRLKHPEPMMRSVADAQHVAQILSEALRAAHTEALEADAAPAGTTAQAAVPQPSAAPAPIHTDRQRGSNPMSAARIRLDAAA